MISSILNRYLRAKEKERRVESLRRKRDRSFEDKNRSFFQRQKKTKKRKKRNENNVCFFFFSFTKQKKEEVYNLEEDKSETTKPDIVLNLGDSHIICDSKVSLDNWKKCGGTVSNKVNNLKLGNYTANKERKELVVNLDQMIKASKDKDNVILDARSKKRFFGEAKEPRPNLPSGHIPNSQSLPSSDLIDERGYLRSLDEINQIFEKINVSTNDKIIATCGSGVSACVLAIALYCLGKTDTRVYDGSWTEWASTGQEVATK